MVKLTEFDKNTTIELLKWNGEYCYTLAYWVKTGGRYELKFVGDRPFEDIGYEDTSIVWDHMHKAQRELDRFLEEY